MRPMSQNCVMPPCSLGHNTEKVKIKEIEMIIFLMPSPWSTGEQLAIVNKKLGRGVIFMRRSVSLSSSQEEKVRHST